MGSWRLSASVFVLACVGWGGCRFDPTMAPWGRDGGSGEIGGRRDDGGRPDGTGDGAPQGEASVFRDAGGWPEAAVGGDAGCVPGTRRCVGEQAQTCDSSGTWVLEQDCPAGCNAATGTCYRVVASNGLGHLVWADPGEDVVISGRVVLNSDTGAVVEGADSVTGSFRWTRVQQSEPCGGASGAEKDIGVFRVRSLWIQAGGELRVVGESAVAFLAEGPIEIAGVLDVSGGRKACPGGDPAGISPVLCSGPGGFRGGIGAGGPTPGGGPGGGRPGGNGGAWGSEAGGGGGGHAGGGGKGGDATDAIFSASGGAGGRSYGGQGEPLCGGSGGGGGGPGMSTDTSDQTSHGGGGGGAVQLVSQVRIRVQCPSGGPCGIRATGGGGMGDHLQSIDDGGGGGGAGGLVLLEAPAVEVGVHAIVSVAGGGGGAGRAQEDGDDGPFGPGRAQGGQDGAHGGAGGGAGFLDGDKGEDAGDGGAGGGGAAGWILVHCHGAPGCFTLRGTVNPDPSTPAVSVSEVGVE